MGSINFRTRDCWQVPVANWSPLLQQQMVPLLNTSMIHNSLPVVDMRAEVTAGMLAGTGTKLELTKLESPLLYIVSLFNTSVIHNSLPVVVVGAEVTAGVTYQ